MTEEPAPPTEPTPRKRPVQFTLRRLFLVMVVCAVALKTTTWLGVEVLPFLVAALGVFLLAIGRRRYLLVWLIPSLWATCTVGSWHHPGDEYGLFLLSLLPSVWLAPFLHFTHLREAYLLLIGAGFVPMMVVGLILDRLRVPRLLWATIYIAASVGLFAWTLLSFPSLERAIGKNGSISAYVYAAANVGLYLSVLLSFGICAVRWLWRRVRSV